MYVLSPINRSGNDVSETLSNLLRIIGQLLVMLDIMLTIVSSGKLIAYKHFFKAEYKAIFTC